MSRLTAFCRGTLLIGTNDREMKSALGEKNEAQNYICDVNVVYVIAGDVGMDYLCEHWSKIRLCVYLDACMGLGVAGSGDNFVYCGTVSARFGA